MKQIIVKIALLTFSIAILAAVPAFAQLSGRYHADIPFDFTTGGTSMAAGSYTLGVLDVAQTTGPLVLQAQKGKAFKVLSLVRRGPDDGVSGGKLIFIKSGDEYTLSRIETPQYSWKAKRTMTSVKELAAKREKADTVEVNIAAGN
jgi:hypothetical protein